MKKFLSFGLIAVLAGWAISACNDGENQPKVKFYLTDAPAPELFNAVYIDIQEVKYSTDGEVWKNVPITPAVVNLMDFTNGADTLLSDIVLNEGDYITQVRLVLGDDNTLELADGSSVPIETPSSQTSGLKFNVQENVTSSSSYAIRIDFDASRSIVRHGNGTYSLKPVIRAYVVANTSSVYGYLTPNDVPYDVLAIMDSDTISTLSDTAVNNYFMLQGLSTGTYSIQVVSPGSETPAWTQSVAIFGGTNVNLGTMNVAD